MRLKLKIKIKKKYIFLHKMPQYYQWMTDAMQVNKGKSSTRERIYFPPYVLVKKIITRVPNKRGTRERQCRVQ